MQATRTEHMSAPRLFDQQGRELVAGARVRLGGFGRTPRGTVREFVERNRAWWCAVELDDGAVRIVHPHGVQIVKAS